MSFELEMNTAEFVQFFLQQEPSAIIAKTPPKIKVQKVCLSFDTREIKAGDVFWALVGKTYNPHKKEILQEAFNKGAVMAIVNQAETKNMEIPFAIKTEDTTKALLRFASGYRKKFANLKVVGITGSAGKTSTKEMLSAVIGSEFNTLTTKGNLNNLFGVPMTLLGLNSEHEAAVIEMGTSEKGEIHQLSLCTAPDIAVITNVAPAHLEGLGDLDGVFEEKKSIIDGLKKGGKLVINADDEKLGKIRSTANCKVITYGIKKGVVTPDEIRWENGCADFRIGRTWFKLEVPGLHNVYNALAAIAVGELLKIPKSVIAESLSKVKSYNMRMQIFENEGITIISDCYNANPHSMKMSLETVKNMNAKGRKIAVLGDMKELGEHSAKFHFEIGKELPALGIDYLIAIGKDAEKYCEGAELAGMKNNRIRYFEEKLLAIENLKTLVREGDVVLIKGSRSMKLEEVVNSFAEVKVT